MARCGKCKQTIGDSDDEVMLHWMQHHTIRDLLVSPAYRELQEEEGAFSVPNSDGTKKPS